MKKEIKNMNVFPINDKMFEKMYEIVADTITVDKWVRLYSVQQSLSPGRRTERTGFLLYGYGLLRPQ